MDIEEQLANKCRNIIQAMALDRGVKVFGGIRWNRINQIRKQRKATIHVLCKNRVDVNADYVVRFYQRNKGIAMTRLESMDTIAGSVLDWLEGCSKEALYAKYPEVDYHTRKLQRFHQTMIQLQPGLAAFESGIGGDDLSGYYWSRSENRGFCVESWYQSHFPSNVNLSWDGTLVAEFWGKDAGEESIAGALNAWLIEEIPPSKMVQQFSFINLNSLATYFEAGKGVEGEFIQSWNETENLYKTLYNEGYPEVLDLMQAMRDEGFDHIFRAGTSWTRLILSRSRRHGMLPDAAFLKFFVRKEENRIEISDHKDLYLVQQSLEYTDAIRQLLLKLAEEPIG